MKAEVETHVRWGGPKQALVRCFAVLADVTLGLGIKMHNHRIFFNVLNSTPQLRSVLFIIIFF